MKNSFKPTERVILSATLAPKAKPLVTGYNVTAALWDLVLLEGIAQLSNNPLVSGTVALWYNSTVSPTIGNAEIVTFTDATGYYAVTVKANTKYKVKLYS